MATQKKRAQAPLPTVLTSLRFGFQLARPRLLIQSNLLIFRHRYDAFEHLKIGVVYGVKRHAGKFVQMPRYVMGCWRLICNSAGIEVLPIFLCKSNGQHKRNFNSVRVPVITLI